MKVKRSMLLILIIIFTFFALYCFNVYTSKQTVKADRVYYNQLTIKEKIAYKKIANKVVSYKNIVSFNFLKFDSKAINKIITTYFFENPELFYLGKRYTVELDSKNNVKYIYLDFVLSKDQYFYMLNEVNEKVDIIKDITRDMSNIEKLEYVYKYLSISNDYKKDGYFFNSIYGGIVLGKANCEGISSSYMYIMNKLNVPTFQALGSIKKDDEYENHSWNIAYVDDEFFYVDATFAMSYVDDDGNIINNKFYEYMNMTCSESLKDRDVSIQKSMFGVYCMD